MRCLQPFSLAIARRVSDVSPRALAVTKCCLLQPLTLPTPSHLRNAILFPTKMPYLDVCVNTLNPENDVGCAALLRAHVPRIRVIHTLAVPRYMAFCSAVMREHETGSSVFTFAVAQVRAMPACTALRTACLCVTFAHSFSSSLPSHVGTFPPPHFPATFVVTLEAAAPISRRIFTKCVLAPNSLAFSVSGQSPCLLRFAVTLIIPRAIVCSCSTTVSSGFHEIFRIV